MKKLSPRWSKFLWSIVAFCKREVLPLLIIFALMHVILATALTVAGKFERYPLAPIVFLMMTLIPFIIPLLMAATFALIAIGRRVQNGHFGILHQHVPEYMEADSFEDEEFEGEVLSGATEAKPN